MTYEWQKIETAPKEKELLLIGWNAKWMQGKGVPCIMIWAKHLASNKMCWMDFSRAYPIEPTHWMPAPTSPFREVEQNEI